VFFPIPELRHTVVNRSPPLCQAVVTRTFPWPEIDARVRFWFDQNSPPLRALAAHARDDPFAQANDW